MFLSIINILNMCQDIGPFLIRFFTFISLLPDEPNFVLVSLRPFIDCKIPVSSFSVELK